MSSSLAQGERLATIDGMPRSSPTSRRRDLSKRLKQLREENHVSVEEAAEALGCSTDKIHWIERADWTDPKWRDVRDLLDRYGVTDNATRDELIELAKTGGERDWWQPYSRTLSKRRSKYSTYLGLEADATGLLTYQLSVIPGLLQTDEYAHALIESGPDVFDAQEVDELVKVRAERRRILEGDDPVQLWAVIDEAALRRQVGGSDVMRAQLKALVELGGRTNITLQVVTFDQGAHPALAGSFTILSFGEGFPDVAYVETIGGELLVDKDEGVERYRQVFRRMNVAATRPDATIAMLAAQAADT